MIELKLLFFLPDTIKRKHVLKVVISYLTFCLQCREKLWRDWWRRNFSFKRDKCVSNGERVSVEFTNLTKLLQRKGPVTGSRYNGFVPLFAPVVGAFGEFSSSTSCTNASIGKRSKYFKQCVKFVTSNIDINFI